MVNVELLTGDYLWISLGGLALRLCFGVQPGLAPLPVPTDIWKRKLAVVIILDEAGRARGPEAALPGPQDLRDALPGVLVAPMVVVPAPVLHLFNINRNLERKSAMM